MALPMAGKHRERSVDGDNSPMNKADAPVTPSANVPSTSRRRLSFKNFFLTGLFVPYLVLSALGVAVVVVIASIAFNALKNHGLIPPPNTLDRYECAGSGAPFTFYYLHGTERVKIKSSEGILEGTVYQNQFDWASFAHDPTLLGFLPPVEISFEDATSLRVKGPGSAEVVCSIAVKHSGERRAIVR